MPMAPTAVITATQKGLRDPTFVPRGELCDLSVPAQQMDRAASLSKVPALGRAMA